MDTPAAPWPAFSVASTRGGFALRSITLTWSLGVCLVPSFGSTLFDAVTSARLSSVVTATLSGGPTTLTGAGTSPITRGGEVLRSMIDTVSGGAPLTTVTTPFTRTTLLSLADTAIWASATGVTFATARRARATTMGARRYVVMVSSCAGV